MTVLEDYKQVLIGGLGMTLASKNLNAKSLEN